MDTENFQALMTRAIKNNDAEEFSITEETPIVARELFNWINQYPLSEDTNTFHDRVAIDLIDNMLTVWSDDPEKAAQFIESTKTILQIYFTETSHWRLAKVCDFLKNYWLAEMTL